MGYRLGLVTVYVRDVARARAFYADTLGIEVVERLSGPDFVFLKPEWGTPVALRSANQLPPGFSSAPGGFDLGLEVDDVDATLQDWKAKGITIVADVADMGAGRAFVAKDPEGNLLDVYQLYPPVRDFRKQLGI